MKIAITGISSGLGAACFHSDDARFSVFGISHSQCAPEKNIYSYSNLMELPTMEVLILNAAIGDSGGTIQEMNPVELEQVMYVNVLQPIQLIHELFQLGKLTHLKQLILVGSRFSSQAYISSSIFENLTGYAYCLSKTSLSLFAQILRKESHNFTVNIIHPGILNSEMGNPDGNHPTHTCEVLFELIANDYFLKEYSGIVDISTSKIIDF